MNMQHAMAACERPTACVTLVTVSAHSPDSCEGLQHSSHGHGERSAAVAAGGSQPTLMLCDVYTSHGTCARWTPPRFFVRR